MYNLLYGLNVLAEICSTTWDLPRLTTEVLGILAEFCPTAWDLSRLHTEPFIGLPSYEVELLFVYVCLDVPQVVHNLLKNKDVY
ncbi:hypothetical protein HAX54_040108 [Datura stramonium]|uniref:Uncharacterized protein n=1 Tax=Datura stramonium TaxID=4076 RepID=A0ABS8SJX5_DATST|nr:hypothetical protein [Datura stramonium]